MQCSFMSDARNFQFLRLYISNRSLEYDFLSYIEDVSTTYFWVWNTGVYFLSAILTYILISDFNAWY
jgi:hypothetical protein